ncbi:MAG: nucleoside monophosphate kinase [Clostridiales bacterium]|jgi:adenylate kinase|nr:nucleoside monophosphate kinase [Clostridiales bacterium]
MRIILLGAPGSGKGTHAEKLSKHFFIENVSTGKIIRDIIESKSELGKLVSDFVKNGELISDNIVCKIINEKLKSDKCKNGYVLDGFPRTLQQARKLEEFEVKVDAAILIEVSESIIIERLTGRVQCKECGNVYNVKLNPPKVVGICDTCGKNLIIRDDDNVPAIQNRLRIYQLQVAPIVDFYKNKNLLKVVYGKNNIEGTFTDILNVLE